MASNTLTLPNIADQLNKQFDRMLMLQELTRMTIESLPNSTDSDVPLALLNGMQEILQTDAHKMYLLLESMAKPTEPVPSAPRSLEREVFHG
jgi:hypothetical protein